MPTNLPAAIPAFLDDGHDGIRLAITVDEWLMTPVGWIAMTWVRKGLVKVSHDFQIDGYPRGVMPVNGPNGFVPVSSLEWRQLARDCRRTLQIEGAAVVRTDSESW
jgi:hypothetical protein